MWGSTISESDKLAELEAILYAASRPIELTDIVSRLRLENEVEADHLVDELIQVYIADDSALEIKKLPH
jgi:chromosome segregation and condensation protein ScpB